MPDLIGSPPVTAALAALPIVLILALMLGRRWSAARAGAAGLLVAAVLALAVFGFAPAGVPDAAREFAGVAAEGAFTSATILWILWPALALHHHQQRCGAIDTLRSSIGRITVSRPMQALLVGWFLALFLEGAAGFGTPIALAAPLLVGLGVPPVQAVVLPLLGHALGVSFGALGTPVLAQVALTGLDAIDIAWRTALLHVVPGGLLMVFFMRALSGGGGEAAASDRTRPAIGWAVFATAAFLVPSVVIASSLGPELATLGGALAGGLLFGLVLRSRREQGADKGPAGHATTAAGVRRALWPYAILVLLVLASRAFAPLAEALGSVQLQWEWRDRYAGRMQPLAHPGTLLFAALVIGALLQGVRLRELLPPLAQAARRLLPVTAALLAMLCLSRLMLHAGMIATLERAAVRWVGESWPLVAPAVGALGSFVTGSATASNVLFTSLQAQTAQALHLPVVVLVAAQGFGAAIGNIVCPHNIVAGAATVGLAGREAEILRRTLLPCALYLVLGGLLVTLMVVAG
jgi:lactate permease